MNPDAPQPMSKAGSATLPIPPRGAAGKAGLGVLSAESLPPFARREDYAAYFARLVDFAPADLAMRRLLSHVDADLDASQEVALLAAVWRCAAHLAPEERSALAQCLDGRHAELLQRTRQPWWEFDTIIDLATRRLQSHTAAGGAFVTALLRHHGIDAIGRPQAHPPALVMLAVRAALATAASRLDEPTLHGLQAAALHAAEQEPAQAAGALAVLFDLALHARDASTADATLAQLLDAGCAGQVPLQRVQAWLDGSAWVDDPALALPLQLEPPLQAQWLRPTEWRDATVLGRLAGALQRAWPRARLTGLATHLGIRLPDCLPVPRPPVLQALNALDACYAAIEAGADVLAPSQAALASPGLSTLARATLREYRAHQCASGGHADQAAVECAHARRLARRPNARAALQRLMTALAAPTWPHDFAFGPDWTEEEPLWRRLLDHPDAAARRIATYHLARLSTQGSLEPGAPRKCQHLQEAQPLWRALADHPAYAAEARHALSGLPLTFMRRVQSHAGGRDHLWIPAPEAGSERLTIVFSCLTSHHTHPEVQQFAEGLHGQHLLFIRNPEFNWYSDAAFDSVCRLIEARVLPRFRPEHVSCHYGSMGGHAALKIALQFGFRALVFNPQTDLDLWAAFRAGERRQLWGAERHASLHHWPDPAFERMPLYYACGSHTADREALSAVLQRLRRCAHATAIIEKFNDPHHPGLMARISGGSIPGTLLAIGRRLDTLAGPPAAGAMEVPGPDVPRFWDRLDAAAGTKVEIQVRQGRLWSQLSTHTSTRHASEPRPVAARQALPA